MEKGNANKHLTYEERQYIEIGLNQGRSFSEIAEDIKKDRRTISREIQKHRFEKIPGRFNNSGNKCKYKNECKKFDCTSEKKCYEEDICEITIGVPYVCNGCEKKSRSSCPYRRQLYTAKKAQAEYDTVLVESRTGIRWFKSLQNGETPILYLYFCKKIYTANLPQKQQKTSIFSRFFVAISFL